VDPVTTLPRSTFILLILGLGALACEPEGTSGWSGTETDSAGLRLVLNPIEPLWSPEDGWWVEEVVRVEPVESVPETLFGYVVDADLDSEGRIYALDQQARAVRVFDGDGAFVRTLGGPGEGPGEIGAAATSLVVRGDTVLVADWTQGHLDRYRTDGTVLSPFAFPDPIRGRGWMEVGADRLWLRTLELADEGEGWRSLDRLWRLDGDAPVPVLTFTYRTSDLGARGAPRLPVIVNAPMWAVFPDGRLVWSTLEAPEVRVEEWSGEGAARPVGRLRSEAWRARPPSAEDLRALRILVGERLEMLGGDASTVEAIPVVEPPVLPVMTDLVAGPEGTLWVQRTGDLRAVHPMATNTPDPPGGWGGATWDVLDREGRYLGSVELPPRFRLMAFRGELLVGAVADPRNVDSLVVLRLNRPAAP
jgi:hypothetical protein